MYYKLLNKNLLTAALVSLMTLSATGTSDAQGVVSLVADEDISMPQQEADVVVDTQANMDMDMELPNTLPEDDDVIPLDSNMGMISPTPAAAPMPAIVQNAPQAPLPEQVIPAEPENFEEDVDFSLGLENSIPSTPAAKATPASSSDENPLFAPKEALATNSDTETFGNSVLSKIDNGLFNQMSDIEKQTTLLTLELRREKIRNEIEAIKAQRVKATEEKAAAEAEKKRKDFEWEKDQEAKVLKEQQLLKEKEIELEKIKQKKALNAYMNKMLEQNQKWIKDNADIYKQMRQVEADRKSLVENFKGKLENLTVTSNKIVQSANSAKSNHDRTLASLTAQNIQLKKRIDADAIAAKNRQQNPFGTNTPESDNSAISTSIDSKIVPINISKEYAIMDITGKGEELVAKLINKEGDSFLARRGTVLQTGHAVEDITPTYIQFDRNGLKDYLYTTGSALTMEPDKMEGTGKNTPNNKRPVLAAKPLSAGIASDRGVPSLGTGMFVK